MKDAYFHIDISPAHRHFLRFIVDSNHFQYRALTFRTAIAPRVFIKIFLVVEAHVR